jgi:tripartite-type tricarboxylate transporter receptor subunit TctC
VCKTFKQAASAQSGRMLHALWLGVCMLAMPYAARADYPDKPIRIVVPFAAGGPTDILARLIGEGLQARLGQPAIADNKPGGGGNLGTDSVAKAAPDGYTLLLGYIGPHAINQALYGKLPFRPIDDFTPITLLVTTPLVVAAHPSVTATTMGDLVKLAKASPKPLFYASPGSGSANHMATELFRLAAGIELVQIPYKGLAPAVMDVVAGQVPFIFSGLSVAIPQIKAGKLRALAVTTRERAPTLPDVPTMQEAGFRDFDVSAWFGLLGPAKLPQPILERLEKATRETMATKEAGARVQSLGMVTRTTSPAEFGRFMKSELEVWSKVVKDSGAKPE